MSLINSIRPGDRVTIVNRFNQRQTGRAVMKGPYGWVLNLGGAHGTPGIATHENVVDVKTPKGKAKYTGSNPEMILGSQLSYAAQQDALRSYVHRFTGDHKPRWASKKRPDGSDYKVQFSSDQDWLKHTKFPVKKDGNIGRGSCYSTPTWPRGSNPPRDRIVYERGPNVVVTQDDRYLVLRHTATHAVTDSSYPKNSDGLSLAKARCDYLFKAHGNKPYFGKNPRKKKIDPERVKRWIKHKLLGKTDGFGVAYKAYYDKRDKRNKRSNPQHSSIPGALERIARRQAEIREHLRHKKTRHAAKFPHLKAQVDRTVAWKRDEIKALKGLVRNWKSENPPRKSGTTRLAPSTKTALSKVFGGAPTQKQIYGMIWSGYLIQRGQQLYLTSRGAKYLLGSKTYDENPPRKGNPAREYDDLTIIPKVVAETVCQRRGLSQNKTKEFSKIADKRCRAAYAAKSPWFMKIVNSKSNHGRDTLYMFVNHWLDGFEKSRSHKSNPKHKRRSRRAYKKVRRNGGARRLKASWLKYALFGGVAYYIIAKRGL